MKDLMNEIALAIDAFISLRVERDTLASELTQEELSEMALGIIEIVARQQSGIPSEFEEDDWVLVHLNGFKKGRKAERDKIVAWLREQDGHGYDDMRANCIEAGEHLK